MKTERRHELQTNVLADWLGKHLQQVQGYSKTILAVVLLLIAAGIAGMYLAQSQSARSQAGWNQFYLAFGERDPKALDEVAAANQGMVAGVWAHLAEADLKLAEGIGDLYTNRDNAEKNLAEAERNYLAVDRAATESLLRERAWFGLGQVYESMDKLDKAKEYYGKLAAQSPASALGKEAKARADALNDAATEKWYNWFANQKPQPPGMQDGFGMPGLSEDLESLSDRPDLSFPMLPPATSDPAAAAKSSEPEPELNSPATEATPAPPEQPAAADPENSATPKASETPAASTPSEPAPSEPAPSEPAPSEPAPSEPAPSEPAPSEPASESSDAPPEGSSAPGESAPE